MAARAGLEAVRTLGIPFTHVDVTDAFDRKVAALLAHESQHGDQGEEMAARIREWGEDHATDAGLPGRIVEGFRAILIE